MAKPDWVRQHVEEYRKDPERAHMWDSSVIGGPGEVPCLLLTTVGRRSGQERTTPLIYAKIDGDYVVVASKGGAPNHPAWYLNLQENPEVEIQVASEKLRARAAVVEGEKREQLWAKMVEVWPDYANYQRKTDRRIPIVALAPQ